MPGSVNGFGTMYYGQRQPRHDGSYVTTNFFCLCFLPIIPLHSVRVIPDPKNSWLPFSKNHYLVLQQRWPDPVQVISIYLCAAAAIAMSILFFWKIDPYLRQHLPWLDTDTMKTVMFSVCALAPVLAALLLRSFLLKHARARGAQKS
ncbi:MAG: hypothetical protein WBM14_13230 [Terracidiphilus sp.]